MDHIILTGSGRGLGKAFLDAALEKEFFLGIKGDPKDRKILSISRRPELEVSDNRITHISCDLSTIEGVQKAVASFPEPEHGESIVLINNAALLTPLGLLYNQGIQAVHEIYKAMSLNCSAVFALSAAFLKKYSTHNSPRKLILQITSGAATSPMEGAAVYCASKSALNMFSRSIAPEAEKAGVLVISVSPGMVETEMQETLRSTEDFPAAELYQDAHNDGHVAQPEDVVGKIVDWDCFKAVNGTVHHVRDLL
jgi:benzil reductase ((S)-benzoin forming)